MTRDELADELRALRRRIAGCEADRSHILLEYAKVLTRLATAEAALAVVREIVGDYFEGADGHDSMVELRSRLAAVARREQPDGHEAPSEATR